MQRITRLPRRKLAYCALLCTAAFATGCGDEEKHPSASCPGDPEAVLAALRSAPGEVRVGGMRLSECLTEGSNGDEVQRIGTAYVGAAAKLAPQADRRPEGRAAVRLGYLVGAVRHGASVTHGVHSELVRRLAQERLPSAAFRRGERAGLRDG